MKTALVLGAGGFIGSHLVKRLKSEGYWVRGIDLKCPEFSKSEADEFLIYDLRDPRNVEAVMRVEYYRGHSGDTSPMPFTYSKTAYCVQRTFDEVYQLAADMGGAGYVFTGEHDADIMHNSAQINLNVCHWAKEYGVGKLLYSSSACMYPQELQNIIKINTPGNGDSMNTVNYSLKESDAYPANPDSEYGWEKLFSERLYIAYTRNYGLNVRIARFHNIYGPEGTYKGGREKAPAAMCRKAIELRHAVITEGRNTLEVWGTGHQKRSFLYIDDCIDAVRLLMQSDFKEPINIGSEEMITINQLAEMAIKFTGRDIKIQNVTGPVGVHGRNSDNTLIRRVLGWEPAFNLEKGLDITFNWIKSQYERNI